MVLPSYRAWLCCGVKTAVTGSVEDTLEPAANKSRFQSRYELLVQYLLYRADLESFLLTVFWPVNLEYISPIRATIEQPLISLTASLHLFMNFQDERILLSLSLSCMLALSLSRLDDLLACFGMELWQEPPHFINAGKGGQKMYQMAPPICSLPFGQVD